MKTRLIIGCLVLLVVLGAVLVIWDDEPVAEVAAVEVPAKRLTALTKSQRLGSAVVTRTVAIETRERTEVPAFDPYEEWTTGTILNQFGILPGKFEGASIDDVVVFFEETYAQHGGHGIEFRVEGSGGFPVTCEYGNVMATSLMDVMAGLAGYEVVVGDGEVVFRRVRLPHAASGMQSVSLDMGLGQRLMQADGELMGDPFSEVGSELEAPNVEAVVAGLAKFGLDFESGVEVDAEDGRIWISNVGAEIERALAVYQFVMHDEKAADVLVSTKMLSADPSAAGFENLTYSDPEFQVAIRGMSQIEGVSLLSAPSVVMTVGQTATIEVIRELVYPVAGENVEPVFETREVGLTLEITPMLAGLDRVQLSGAIDQTLVDGQELGVAEPSLPEAGTELGEDSFRSFVADFEGGVFDGDTAGFVSAEEGEVAVYHFITVRRISPSGRPVLSGRDE